MPLNHETKPNQTKNHLLGRAGAVINAKPVIQQISIVNYDYYHYFTSCEFFKPTLDDRLSQETKWQQVSSGLQNSFQYVSQSQQRCSLDDLDSSSNFLLLSFQAFWDRSKYIN